MKQFWRQQMQRGALSFAVCAAAAVIGVDRSAARWDIALLAIAVVVGWIPALVCVTATAVVHFVQHHDGDAVLTFLVLVGGGLTTGAVLRRPAPVGALPRRASLVYAQLVPIVIAAALAQTAVQASGLPARAFANEILHVAIGIAAAALFAHLPWSTRRGPFLWAPSAALLATLALLLTTVGLWDRQDSRTLQNTVDATAVAFNVNLGDESSVLSTKAAAYTDLPYTAATFGKQLQTVVFGHDVITSAAMIDYVPSRGVVTEAVLSDYGSVFEDALTAWLSKQRGAQFDLLATSGSTVFLGMASFPVPVPDPEQKLPDHPQLVYAAPLIDKAGFDPTHPRLLVVTLSLPLLISRALAVATATSDDVAIALYNTTAETPSLIWQTVSTASSADSGSSDPTDVDTDTGHVARTDLSVDALQFTMYLARGKRFGTPLTTRRLIVVLELLAGLGGFALTLQLTHDRARRERERRQREVLLGTALEGAPGWTAIIDGDDRVLVGNNDANGVGVGEHVDGAALWASDRPTAHRAIEAIHEARRGHDVSITLTPAPQSEGMPLRIFEVLCRAIDTGESEGLTFLQCVDVTERRELAMRTAQSERMESIGVLAGSLAHDFNNLLFITQGYLQMMERQPTVANDPQLNRFVAKAADAVQRGATIAKSLLAVARSQPMTTVPLSMNQFMLDIDPLLAQALGDKDGIELHKEIIGDELDVIVDPGRLSSAVLNLVFNARDAMENGGTITIRAQRTIATDASGEHREVIAVEVHDTGKGMSPEVAARAYEPFFTTGKIGKGTGLGLAAVYSFAQQSGGWTTIDSREGVGTTVSIFLTPAITSPTGEISPARVSEQRLRALVVDDEESLGELVAGWLAELGFETRVASDSKTALAKAEEFRPHLLVSDANLGEEIDGAELAAQLTNILPTLVTVFMTGFSDRLRALETVGAMTLAKPFSRDDLNTALIKVLGPRLAEGTTENTGPAAS